MITPYYKNAQNILTLLHTAETADGRTGSDHLICRLIYDPKHKKFFPDLAQWLPALKKPQRVLGNYLQAAWSNPRLNINDPNNQKEIHINLVVWCQRNPSAAATAFLRKHSDHHPDALLGLALADPLRYRVQIEKAAAKMAPTPALTIAVLMSHGREAGADFLATLSSYTEKPELVEKAIRLMEAIDALDWQAFAVAADYSDKQLHYCLPLIMRRIWDSLSEPAGTAGVDRLLSIDAARFLKDVGVNLYGLCLNVIAGLHRYDDQVSDNLCLGVRRLFFASGFNIPGEFRLWFNDLSGDRLFAANASDLDVYPETLWFEDPLFSDLYPLLFTKNGERRSVCRLPWINVEPFALPLLRQEASRFARLLVEKLYPQNPRFIEQGCCTTQLELEELLIDQFKQKLEQENTKNGTEYQFKYR